MYPWLEKLVDKAKKKVSGHKPNLDDDVVPDPLIWSKDLEQHYYGDYLFAQVRGNENMEDGSHVVTGHEATFVGVYDGHGGHHASHFIPENLFDHLTRFVQENGTMALDNCQLYLPKQVQRLYLPKLQRPVQSAADESTSTKKKLLIMAASMYRRFKWMFNFIDLRDVYRKLLKSKLQKKSGRVFRQIIGDKPPVTPSLKPFLVFPSYKEFLRKLDIFPYRVRSCTRGLVRSESDENIGYCAIYSSHFHPPVPFLGPHLYENFSTLSSFIEFILNRGLLEVLHGASGLFILIQRDILHLINRGHGIAEGVILYETDGQLHARRLVIRPYQAIKIHDLYRYVILGVGGCLDGLTNDDVIALVNLSQDAMVIAEVIINRGVRLNVGTIVITFS